MAWGCCGKDKCIQGERRISRQESVKQRAGMVCPEARGGVCSGGDYSGPLDKGSTPLRRNSKSKGVF